MALRSGVPHPQAATTTQLWPVWKWTAQVVGVQACGAAPLVQQAGVHTQCSYRTIPSPPRWSTKLEKLGTAALDYGYEP